MPDFAARQKHRPSAPNTCEVDQLLSAMLQKIEKKT